MKNKAHITGNALLWMLVQIYLDQVNPIIVKGAHPSVSDLDLNCEKVCVNYTNGDAFEYVVDDKDNKVCVRFVLKQWKTNTRKIIKGKHIYRLPKWPDEFESSQLTAYIAKLMYIIKDVYATYKKLYIRNKVYMVYA